ncbi:MAG: hypothetical protein IPF93_13500 [Saprospiraceae bacterium]|nr:hypothetical protein [Saprospiraceae bacterium]
MLIIDEEQKFGLCQRKTAQTQSQCGHPDIASDSHPRTLQFSLLSARDMSVMRTPPANRQPVHTERITFDEATIRDAIHYEVNRGAKVVFRA